jgi:hypothetical protein
MALLGQKKAYWPPPNKSTTDVNNPIHQTRQANQQSSNLYNLLTIKFQAITHGENKSYS